MSNVLYMFALANFWLLLGKHVIKQLSHEWLVNTSRQNCYIDNHNNEVHLDEWLHVTFCKALKVEKKKIQLRSTEGGAGKAVSLVLSMNNVSKTMTAFYETLNGVCSSCSEDEFTIIVYYALFSGVLRMWGYIRGIDRVISV